MADASQVFIYLLAAGNGSSASSRASCDIGLSRVRRILLTFPAGCGGLVGVRVEAAQGYAFPNQPGQFYAFDDYTYTIDVSNQIDSGKWSLVTYNTDYIIHAITAVFEYDYVRGNDVSSNNQPIAI